MKWWGILLIVLGSLLVLGIIFAVIMAASYDAGQNNAPTKEQICGNARSTCKAQCSGLFKGSCMDNCDKTYSQCMG